MANTFDGNDETCETEKFIPFTFIHQEITQNIYHYYISTIIDAPHYYVDIINRLHTAGPNDIVHLHLNTDGGYMSTGIQIINAMNASQAHVIASVEGEVSSMGTMIFLAANEFLVHENSVLMFHNYTGGVWGKQHEQIAAIESSKKWTEDFLHRIYYPFMTTEEIDRLLKGEDIYMHPPEVIYRLKVMQKIREEEYADAQAEIDLELEEAPKPKPTRKKRATKKKTASRKR